MRLAHKKPEFDAFIVSFCRCHLAEGATERGYRKKSSIGAVHRGDDSQCLKRHNTCGTPRGKLLTHLKHKGIIPVWDIILFSA